MLACTCGIQELVEWESSSIENLKSVKMDIQKRENESDKFTKIDTESATIPGGSDHSGSLIRRVKDSFKQSNLHVITEDLENSEQSEQEKIQWKLASQPYQKVLKQRHLTMIAIGGTLGTGLFKVL